MSRTRATKTERRARKLLEHETACYRRGIPAYVSACRTSPWCICDACMRARGYSSTYPELCRLLRRTPVPGGIRQQLYQASDLHRQLDAEFRERVDAYGT